MMKPNLQSSLMFERKLKNIVPQRLDLQSNQSNYPIGTIIGDRYQVKEKFPSIGDLAGYIVHDVVNNSRCGICGTKHSGEPMDYCHRCGLQLCDSLFLLLEGNLENTKGFEPLIGSVIKQKGVLTFFDKFYFHDNYYIVAQHNEPKSLAEIGENIDSSQLLDWAIVLIQALDFLHRQNIFNIDLSLNHIFLCSEGPCLVNLSKAEIIKNPERESRRLVDIKNYAKACIVLLAKMKPEDQSLSYLFT